MRAVRYDGVLAQITGVYPSATTNESKYVRDKAYKNKGFAEAAIISNMATDEKVGTKRGRKNNNSDDNDDSDSD